MTLIILLLGFRYLCLEQSGRRNAVWLVFLLVVLVAAFILFNKFISGEKNNEMVLDQPGIGAESWRELRAFRNTAVRKARRAFAFKCRHCGKDQATVSVFRMPLDPSLFQFYGADSIWWVRFSCLECGLTEIYNYNIAVDKEYKFFSGKELLRQAEGVCLKCAGKSGTVLVPVFLHDRAITRNWDMMSVKYNIHVCLDCGHSAFYQPGQAVSNPGGWKLLQNLNRMAKEFQCPKCLDPAANTAVIHFYRCSGNSFNVVAVNCKKCGFTLMYDYYVCVS
ncbi:MAG: hypothetical protein WC418_00040 [Candidatus Omnitrophota bacterium]